MNKNVDYTDLILSKFSKATSRRNGVEPLIHRYQSLAIISINFYFFFSFLTWKLAGLVLAPLPGDEVIYTITPFLVLSMLLLKTGRKELAAAVILVALHTGNFLASKICNVKLGASYAVILIPGLAYFVSSSSKVHLFNILMCLLQNVGHISRIKTTFEVTMNEDQRLQIFTLEVCSFVYILLSWVFFALQKHMETKLLEVAQCNFVKAENITKELVEAVAAKDNVVSLFSHEMRNPLNALAGSIDYLFRVIKDTSQLKVLQNARLSKEVLLHLVNNVLDAAKLKAEKMDLVYGTSSCHEVVHKALSINAETLKEKHIYARSYIQKKIPQKLYIDSSRVLQIIMNLISNAIKFTPEGGTISIYMQWYPEDTPKETLLKKFENKVLAIQRSNSEKSQFLSNQTPSQLPRTTSQTKIDLLLDTDIDELSPGENQRQIQKIDKLRKSVKRLNMEDICHSNSWLANNFYFSTQATEMISDATSPPIGPDSSKKGFLQVQISDSGRGIQEENISKLFNMFAQLNHGNNFQNNGTGLGLWICKQLCQKMGGDITMYSQPGKGTTTVFYIPVDNAHLNASMNLPVLKHPGKLRALVVDDYSYNRDVHKLILEREGVEVSLAFDGQEALEKYKSHNEGYFSFIMMDIQMPIMDGLTAAKEMRMFDARFGRKQTDIYFVSGNYHSKNEILESLDCGKKRIDLQGIEFLRKPIDLMVIKKIISNHEYE